MSKIPDDVFEGAVRPDISMEKETVIVNPNPGRSHQIQIDGRPFTMEPFVKIRIDAAEGARLANYMERNWAEMVDNARLERQEWARCMSSLSQAIRDRAVKYADAKGNTNTQPPPAPFVVDLSSEKGRKWYAQGIAIAEGRAVQTSPVNLPMSKESVAATQVVAVPIREPHAEWDAETLKEYITAYGGFLGNNDKPDTLWKKAQTAFEAKKKYHIENKIAFTVV